MLKMSNFVLSQNKKAREARRWRATNTARKRFDGPLREFIKIKHANIFSEYSEFYRQLDRKYPNVRNLAATPMFRDWLSGIQQHESESDDLDEPTHQESSQRYLVNRHNTKTSRRYLVNRPNTKGSQRHLVNRPSTKVTF